MGFSQAYISNNLDASQSLLIGGVSFLFSGAMTGVGGLLYGNGLNGGQWSAWVQTDFFFLMTLGLNGIGIGAGIEHVYREHEK